MRINKRFLNEFNSNFCSERFQEIAKLLLKTGTTIDIDRENSRLSFDTIADNRTFLLTLSLDVTGQIMEFTVTSDVTVYPGALPAVAEFVCRANQRVKKGQLELDFDSGALRSRVIEALSGENLAAPLFRGIATVTKLFDAHYKAFWRVLSGRELPEKALLNVF